MKTEDDAHILERHENKLKGKIPCRLAPDCETKFSSVKEVGIHCRRHHQVNFPWRCSVKDCFECFASITELFRHAELCHDRTAYTENRQFTCSACRKLFDTLDDLMTHTGVHPNNRFGCDECPWKFSSIQGLAVHGQDCHDTRHHPCQHCMQHFESVDDLYQHNQRRHNFECTACYDSFPTADELQAHEVDKHGGPQPDEYEQLQLK